MPRRVRKPSGFCCPQLREQLALGAGRSSAARLAIHRVAHQAPIRLAQDLVPAMAGRTTSSRSTTEMKWGRACRRPLRRGLASHLVIFRDSKRGRRSTGMVRVAGRRNFAGRVRSCTRATILVTRMRSATWQFGWRLVLALALAVAPWPPAAFAIVSSTADAPMEAAPATAEHVMPCHDMQPAAAPAPHRDRGCPDDCCPDPACDPTHCVILHTGLAAPRMHVLYAMPPAATRFALVLDRPPLPPASEQLRPPIA